MRATNCDLFEPHLPGLNIHHLAPKGFDQRAMLPLRQIGWEQRSYLVEAETGFLRGRDQFEYQRCLGRISPVTVRPPSAFGELLSFV